ncbi:MAG TPA: hypothetical protein VFO89_01155, partial [Thermoanaerobaculia bacterium]|nr:hypothetical protein [Thermoanaerobaculia bacterium]
MKRMPLVAVLALLLTTACAHLSVRTEIHDGEGLTQDAKSFARHAEERARATRLAMDTLDTTVVAPLSSRFVDAIASIRQAVPEAVAGTPEQFRDLYLRELSKRTVLALEPEIRRIRDRAVLIETNAATCADNATLRTQLVGMQSDLQQLVDALQTRANENVRAEQEMFVQTVRLAAAAKTNDALATATGFTVSNAAQKSVAVDFLARRAEVAFVDVA